MPCVYMLCGLPFAGKTTLAKRLVQHLGFPYVSIDEINGMRGLGENNSWIGPADWDLTYVEAFRQLDAHLRVGHSVIYDAANFTHAEREDVRALAAQYGASTHVIYVTTPEATVRQRWQANRVTPVRNDIRDDFFKQVVTQFTPPAEDEHVLYYANEQNVEAWIERLTMLEQTERKSL